MLSRYSQGNVTLFKLESAALSEMKDGDISNMTHVENLADVGGVSPDKTVAGTSQYSGSIRDIQHIQEFFKRPVELLATKWKMAPLTPDSIMTLKVWDLWSKEPSVRSKLKNFAYLKGNLMIRFAVSGTPFHYGKFLLSYQPYPQRNSVIQNYPVLGTEAMLISFLNYLSQAPGAYMADVRENKPVDIVCPFISTKQMHRLWNSSGAVAAASSFEDLQDAGTLYITTPTLIRAVNGNTDDPFVQVYAWMEDVELGPPTATVLEITTESCFIPARLESKKEEDTGPIERVSSQIARASGYLESIPYIGPFATASKVAFGALSSISSIFGWSRPAVIEKPEIVKNRAFESPVCIGSDSTQKMTIDPYQGLSVDPSVAGGTGDELAITNIAKIKSLLDVFAWDTETAPLTVLKTYDVEPSLDGPATTGFMQPTAMAFASQPFKYWRGTIRFTIEVACTQFHRGKYLIGFEPNFDAKASLIAAPIKLNKQFQRVIDIQDTQKVEFDVCWNSAREWLVNLPPTLAEASSSASCNGFVYITPFTELISPDTTSDIFFIVSVSCPDLQVMGMQITNLPSSRTAPGALKSDMLHASLESAHLTSSVPASLVELAPSSFDKSKVTLDHFGEEVMSFRTLLKRYTPAYDYIRTKATANSLIRNRRPIYPLGLTYGAANTQIQNLLDYLRFAYLGVRGGLRYRMQFATPDMYDNTYIRCGLTNTQTISSGDTVTALDPSGSTTQNMRANLLGQGLFYRPSNGGVEVELPYYSPNLFNFSFANDYIGTNPGADRNMIETWFTCFDLYYLVRAGNDPIAVTMLMATAEDFNLMRFQGAPFYYIP